VPLVLLEVEHQVHAKRWSVTRVIERIFSRGIAGSFQDAPSAPNPLARDTSLASSPSRHCLWDACMIGTFAPNTLIAQRAT
jgi:hypothetical protein